MISQLSITYCCTDFGTSLPPYLGRWLSRDPIEEKGGLNLYAFVNNDPVNKWDKLGLDFSTWIGNPGYHWDTPTPENNSPCFEAIKEAISMLGKLNNDKRAHCLYSCKITKSCGVVMAHSLAIYKEARDFAWGVIERNVSDRLREIIHDTWQGSPPGECIDDYEANFYGIGLAKDNMNCEKECEIRYGYE
ncbi:MAG: hypothetical protein PHO36_16240 [Parabacteroides sp.]|nr:hypothetical protein [Parabacteroides sp.]